MSPETSIPTESTPSAFNYILSFVLVGVAWGFTTPFIRRAAADFNARQDLKSGGAQDDDQARGQASGVSGEKEYTDEQVIRKRRAGRTAQGTAENDGLAPKESQPFWIQAKIVSLFWTVVNLLRTPAYSVPLVLNLTGSVWFFLLVGKHGESPPWIDPEPGLGCLLQFLMKATLTSSR